MNERTNEKIEILITAIIFTFLSRTHNFLDSHLVFVIQIKLDSTFGSFFFPVAISTVSDVVVVARRHRVLLL